MTCYICSQRNSYGFRQKRSCADSGKELKSEYFVPRQHAVEAILAAERLRDQVGPYLDDF